MIDPVIIKFNQILSWSDLKKNPNFVRNAFFVMSNLSIMMFDGNLVSSLYVTVS